jgi:hypothetical protein
MLDSLPEISATRARKALKSSLEDIAPRSLGSEFGGSGGKACAVADDVAATKKSAKHNSHKGDFNFRIHFSSL